MIFFDESARKTVSALHERAGHCPKTCRIRAAIAWHARDHRPDGVPATVAPVVPATASQGHPLSIFYRLRSQKNCDPYIHPPAYVCIVRSLAVETRDTSNDAVGRSAVECSAAQCGRTYGIRQPGQLRAHTVHGSPDRMPPFRCQQPDRRARRKESLSIGIQGKQVEPGKCGVRVASIMRCSHASECTSIAAGNRRDCMPCGHRALKNHSATRCTLQGRA